MVAKKTKKRVDTAKIIPLRSPPSFDLDDPQTQQFYRVYASNCILIAQALRRQQEEKAS